MHILLYTGFVPFVNYRKKNVCVGGGEEICDNDLSHKCSK